MAEATKDVSEEKLFGMPATTGRWVFVLVGLAIQLCLGAVYGYSVFKTALMNQFDISTLRGNIPFILFLAFFAVVMPFGGKLITKYGPRKICFVGGIIVGVGWLLAGYTDTNFTLLCLTYGVIGGVGVGLAYGAPIATSTKWFPDKKGLAVGLTVGGFGVSAAIVAPIAKRLIDYQKVGTDVVNNDVMDALKIFGIVFIIAIALLSLLLKFPPANWKPAGWQPPAASAAVAKWNFSPKQMIKNRSFIVLWLCFMVGASAGLMAIGMSTQFGRDVIGMSNEELWGMEYTLVTLVSVFAIFNGVGRPIFGWLTDRITPRGTAIISLFMIGAAALAMIPAGDGDNGMYLVSFAILWLGLGAWLAIAPTTTTIFFGARDYTNNYGIVFIAYGVGAIIGNVVSGYAADDGNYDPAFWATVGMAALGIILAALWLKPPDKGPEEETKPVAAAPKK